MIPSPALTVCRSFGFDDQGMSFRNCPDQLFPATGHQALDGSPRNAHFPAGIFLGQAPCIAQQQSLDFVVKQDNLLKITHRDRRRLVEKLGTVSRAVTPPGLFGARGHIFFFRWRRLPLFRQPAQTLSKTNNQ
jgi:hypothetical protein